MKRVDWATGEVEMIPDEGERYEFWDLGMLFRIEKFSVKPQWWLGTTEYEWLSKLHTNHGVMLTGASKDRQEVIAQMMRDIENYKA